MSLEQIAVCPDVSDYIRQGQGRAGAHQGHTKGRAGAHQGHTKGRAHQGHTKGRAQGTGKVSSASWGLLLTSAAADTRMHALFHRCCRRRATQSLEQVQILEAGGFRRDAERRAEDAKQQLIRKTRDTGREEQVFYRHLDM